MLLLDDLSTTGFNHTAFTNDAWTNKKMFPNFVWIVPSPAWKSRRTITNESFMLFAAHVIQQQREKIPTLRRKWDKSSLEEVAQLTALCMSIAEEAISNLPGDGHEAAAEDFLKAFVIQWWCWSCKRRCTTWCPTSNGTTSPCCKRLDIKHERRLWIDPPWLHVIN